MHTHIHTQPTEVATLSLHTQRLLNSHTLRTHTHALTHTCPFPRLKPFLGWRQPSTGLLVIVASPSDWSGHAPASRDPRGCEDEVAAKRLSHNMQCSLLTTSPMHTSDSYIKTGRQTQDKHFTLIANLVQSFYLAAALL